MSKNTDHKDLDQSNDKSSGGDSKKALIKETQIHRAKENNAETIESFGHAFNKLVATATGHRIEEVADRLSPEMAERLYRGRTLDQEIQTGKNPTLSADERQSLSDYKEFKDTISRQIPLFDHDALVDTLNTRIAERVSQRKTTVEPIAKDSKILSAAANVVKASAAPERKSNTAEPPTAHKMQQTEKQKTKIDALAPADKKQVQAHELTDKSTPLSSATKTVHIAKQSDTQLSHAERTEQERSRAPMTSVAGAPAANFRGPMRPDESLPVAAKQQRLNSDSQSMSGHEKPVEDNHKRHSHVENFVAGWNISKMGQNLTPARQREISKSHTNHGFETQPITVKFQKVHALSEKAIKALGYRENFLQRSLTFQYEKPSESVLSKQMLKSDTLIGKQSSLALTVISHQVSIEPGAIRRNLGATEIRECGSIFKPMLDPRAEKHASAAIGLHADKVPMTPSKTASEISRPANEVAKKLVEKISVADKSSMPERAKERVEFFSSLSLKVDAQKRLNLPVSNLLTRTSQVDRVKNTEALPRRAPDVIVAAKRIQSPVRPDQRNATNERTPQPQSKEFVAVKGVVKGQIGERRYILGTEIALAAIIASAGIARVRNDRVIQQDLGSQNDPQTNPALEGDQRLNRLEPRVQEIAEKSRPGVKTETIGRRIDDDIESFAVSSSLLHEVKSNEKQFLHHTQRYFKQILDNNESRKMIKNQTLIRPTILVELNDTLQKIAERYFNDINIAWLIADLNRGNVQESYIDSRRIISMQSRQALILPVWTDIVDFYQTKFANVEIEHLVTIIETSQVDVELYARTFADVIDNKSTRIKTNNTIIDEAQTEAKNSYE